MTVHAEHAPPPQEPCFAELPIRKCSRRILDFRHWAQGGPAWPGRRRAARRTARLPCYASPSALRRRPAGMVPGAYGEVMVLESFGRVCIGARGQRRRSPGSTKMRGRWPQPHQLDYYRIPPGLMEPALRRLSSVATSTVGVTSGKSIFCPYGASQWGSNMRRTQPPHPIHAPALHSGHAAQPRTYCT